MFKHTVVYFSTPTPYHGTGRTVFVARFPKRTFLFVFRHFSTFWPLFKPSVRDGLVGPIKFMINVKA